MKNYSKKVITVLLATIISYSALANEAVGVAFKPTPITIDLGEEGVIAEFLINNTGVYSVSVESLSTMYNLAGMRPEHIAVTHNDDNVGVKFNKLNGYGNLTNESSIEFVVNNAVAADDFYNKSEIYRLEFRPDEKAINQIKEINGVASVNVPSPVFFMDKAVVNTDKLYNVESSHESPWIMAVMQASGNSDDKYAVDVNLKGLYTGKKSATKVTAIVAGKSSFSKTDKDHLMSVSVNNRRLINQREFSDRDLVSVFKYGFATDMGLKNGSNKVELTVHSPITRGIFVDTVEVDAVEISYPREFDAKLGIAFEANAAKYTVKNANKDTRVYRVVADADNNEVVSLLVGMPVSNGLLSFKGVNQNEKAKYYVANSAIELKKSNIRKPLGKTITAASGNSYVVISNSNYVENPALKALANAHNGEIVDVLDIFHTYNHGKVSPEAIKDYIKEAYAAGTRYVLLADGIHHDFKGNLSATRTHQIPAKYISTNQEKWVLSDSWYADVVGDDDLPDLAIGRFPVNNAQELTVLASKSVARLGTSQGGSGKILLVGDHDAGLGFDRFLNRLEENVFEVSNKTTDSLIFEEGQKRSFTGDLMQSLASNPDLVVYSGHSVPTKWGNRNNLFSAADVKNMPNNTSAPIVLALGCFNTYVQSPSSDSIARLLMVSPNGVSAIAGSTGLMSAYRVERYGHLVSENLVEGQAVGDAVMNAKREYVELYDDNSFDVLHGQSLLGDPKNSM